MLFCIIDSNFGTTILTLNYWDYYYSLNYSQLWALAHTLSRDYHEGYKSTKYKSLDSQETDLYT